MILFVEDDPILQRAYRRFFSDAIVVASAEEAIGVLADGAVTFVVSDFDLAGALTGGDLYDHCQKHYASLPFIFLTGNYQKEGYSNAAAWIVKPMGLAALRNEIERYL